MTRLKRAAGRAQRGQAVLEFAFVVPLFLLLMLGLIDFSRLLFTYVSLANGAREMARVAAVTYSWNPGQWNSTNAVTAFNNYALFAAGRNASTDSVTIVTGNHACAQARDTGGTCSGTAVTCPMTSTPTSSPPLATSCTFSAPPSGGFVEVQVSYTFQFAPLFQDKVAGVIDVSFMRPTALVTTTARAYAE